MLVEWAAAASLFRGHLLEQPMERHVRAIGSEPLCIPAMERSNALSCSALFTMCTISPLIPTSTSRGRLAGRRG